MKHFLVQDGSATVLHLCGELDAVSCPELRPVLDTIVDGGWRFVTVDLTNLRRIDVLGVGAMVSLYVRIRANGGEVRFVGVTAQPLVIFKQLNLDHALELS